MDQATLLTEGLELNNIEIRNALYLKSIEKTIVHCEHYQVFFFIHTFTFNIQNHTSKYLGYSPNYVTNHYYLKVAPFASKSIENSGVYKQRNTIASHTKLKIIYACVLDHSSYVLYLIFQTDTGNTNLNHRRKKGKRHTLLKLYMTYFSDWMMFFHNNRIHGRRNAQHI